jgi:hypothetical protein
VQPPLNSAASFFGAAGARKQKHRIFRQPKPFLPTFFGEKKSEVDIIAQVFRLLRLCKSVTIFLKRKSVQM